MVKTDKLTTSVALSGIAFTVAQTIKCIRETQAIVIPPKPAKVVITSSTTSPADSLPNPADLVSISRPFPYADSSGRKIEITTDTEFVDSNLYDPDIPFKWRPLKRQNDFSSESFDPDLFQANLRMFDQTVPPSYIPEHLIDQSSDIAQLGKFLLQIGLG